MGSNTLPKSQPGTLRSSVDLTRCDVAKDDWTHSRRGVRQMPHAESFDSISIVVRAIATSARLRILQSMALPLDIRMRAVSLQPSTLKHRGFLTIPKEGPFACHFLQKERFRRLLDASPAKLHSPAKVAK